MQFREAIKSMECGRTIKRKGWESYLFLDIDGNIKHAGKISNDEKLWMLDTFENDWEEHMTIDIERTIAEEVTTARLESLLDQNSSNIKRMYYLEEMIDGQYLLMKKLTDNFVNEMVTIKDDFQKVLKEISLIKENTKKLEGNLEKIAENFKELKSIDKKIDKFIADTDKNNKKIELEKKKELEAKEKSKKVVKDKISKECIKA